MAKTATKTATPRRRTIGGNGLISAALPSEAYTAFGWDSRITDYYDKDSDIKRVTADNSVFTAQTYKPRVLGDLKLLEVGALRVNIGTVTSIAEQTRRIVFVSKLTQAEVAKMRDEEDLLRIKAESQREAEAEALKAYRARKYNRA